MFGLSKPVLVAIAAGLLTAATAGGIWFIYHKGETAGSSDVKAKVATETVKTLDKARTSKEKADAEVRGQPYSKTVDELR